MTDLYVTGTFIMKELKQRGEADQWKPTHDLPML